MAIRTERRDAKENCLKVLRAARTLFARNGRETGMEDIARAAGVGVGTIYRRYPSKEALIGELVRETCELLLASLKEDLATPASPVEQLRAVFERCFAMAQEHARLLDLHAPSAPDAVRGPCPRTGTYLEIRELVAGIIGEGIADGSLRRSDPVTAAALLLELLHWRSCENVRLSLGLSPEAAASRAFEFAIGGLSS